MTKKLTFTITTIILTLLMPLSGLLISKLQVDSVTANLATRTVEINQNETDFQSTFEQFENALLETNENITTFEGTKKFNLLDFSEVDLVSESDTDVSAEIEVKYQYHYDSEANVITLTATLIDEEGNVVIDEMTGVPFVDENGDLDCVFDCDGEYILLSELQDAGMIENCGWFTKLCKKVSSAVKKVCNTTIGKIGAVATIAIPAVIGVVCAVAAAPVVATVAVGALVGAGIAAGTAAISTYQQDGKVDWETVGICAGVGGAVGALASGVAYGITSAITGGSGATMTGTEKVSKGTGYKSFDAFKKANGNAGENQAWHHIVEQNSDNIAKFGAENIHNTGNLVKVPGGFKGSLHSKITGLYNSTNKAITGSSNMTVRSWLSTKSFDFQYQFGVEKLLEFAKQLGVTVVIP
ncbi:MAG: hypothetical protein IJ415_00265 [Clostridia bacterium]|nr:hypothetical protein [Clostridia bacterium]